MRSEFHRLAGLQHSDAGQRRAVEAGHVAIHPACALTRMTECRGDRHAARRNREHQAVAIFPGQPHRPRSEARNVERDAGLQVHVFPFMHQHRGRAGDTVECVVHHLAAQQRRQHTQILREVGDLHRPLAHAAHRGVTGADAEKHAARRQPVQRCHRCHLDRWNAGAADGGAGTDPQPVGLPRGKRQHRVAVGEQHLAVGHPDEVIAEPFGVTEEADLVDVRHNGKAEFHVRRASLSVA